MEATTTTMAIELGFVGVVFAFIIGIAIVSWVLTWNRPLWLDNLDDYEWEVEFEARPCGGCCDCEEDE